ncbi:MAG TPA: hypothetical protein VK619_18425 [Pyrinomonadaceae bacterium]|nr:hypothetical protein [Pyrinomonadaceae bacterium]
MFVESLFKSDAEVEELVRVFESCELEPAQFSHGNHLAVASVYLTKMTEHEAAKRMRSGLYKFLDAHAVDRQKYHETITVFWVKLAGNFLATTGKGRSLADVINELLELYGNSKLIFEYYSKELIDSDEARLGWVEPDLKPLDFDQAESSQTSISS